MQSHWNGPMFTDVKSAFRGAVKGAAMLLVLSALAGCAALPSADDPQTNFYVLGSIAADAQPLANAPRNPPLVVDLAAVRLPQYLQRSQVVTRVDENRLSLSEFEQWGGSLEKNMMRVLAANLGVLLATPDVHMEARRLPDGVDARVEVEVMQFERGPDGRALLSAQWRVLDDDEKPLTSNVTNLQSAPVGALDTMQTTITAMSKLLADLSQQIAEAIVASHAKR